MFVCGVVLCMILFVVVWHPQRLPWLGRSPAVIEEYLAFLGNLVSAQTVFLCACLKMVVSHFIPSKAPFVFFLRRESHKHT